MFYRLFVPKQAVGANLTYFDLFNAAGSAHDLEVTNVVPVVSGAVAVTGLVGVDLFLTRTTAVGTGGTAATANGTDLTAATFTGQTNSQTLSRSITARLTPTGGATAGAVVSWRCVFTEETNGAAYQIQMDMVRSLYPDTPGLIVPQGSGIRVVQGAVASVGNIGFDVQFKVLPK